MRVLAIVIAALFAVPAVAPAASAHHGNAPAHVEAMAMKKKAKKAKKPKAKKEEYMRAVPVR